VNAVTTVRDTSVWPRLRAALVDRGLPVTAVLTAAVLVVMFYYPVGTVIARGLGGTVDGTGPVLAILGSEFYVGAASGLFTDPLAVPGGIVAWVQAGFPAIEFGLIGFTVYQALLSTVASLALGLPGAYLLARYDFPGRETVRSLTMLPFVLPSIMVAVGFYAMFGDAGVLNDVLGALGLGQLSIMYTLRSSCWPTPSTTPR
jgi:thiamine transport system permease protein